jgi:hypothetical protein
LEKQFDQFAEQQIENNKASADGWVSFAEHRRKVTEVLRGTTRPSRLCVLGAGNCNDLDLNSLVKTHQEIHLVDLDRAAMAQGVVRQGLQNNSVIHLHGKIDITGRLDSMVGWSPTVRIEAADIEAFLKQPILRLGTLLPGPFDVVGSTCLLSQLIHAVVQAVGARHYQFVPLVQAIRAGHLRLLMHLVAPGGVAVLISDIMSSDTYPRLASVCDQALPAVLRKLLRERNFFHGVNPIVVTSALRSDAVLNRQVSGTEYITPWLWNLGPRVYAVCAWKLRKTRDIGSESSSSLPS